MGRPKRLPDGYHTLRVHAADRLKFMCQPSHARATETLRLLLAMFVIGGSLRAAPPNILLILADDMGVGDVSCLNPKSAWKTPHLDRLARDGMIFSDAHSASALCTPTRYTLLTGRYSWRSTLK